MIIVIAAGILGVIAATAFDIYIPQEMSLYAAIVIIASIDSVMGAFKSILRNKFSSGVFVTGFFGNSLLAALLVFFSKKIDLDLYYAVIVVFTMRIFSNFSFIRRIFLKKWSEKLKKC